MMQFDIVTIFPAMIERAVGAGIVGRAIERGTLQVRIRDLRPSRTIAIAWWTMCRMAAGPGWC